MKFDSKIITKTGDFIANNKKPLMYIGGALAVIIIGLAIVTKLKRGIGGFLADKSKGVSNFIPLKVDASKVTITEEQANAFANQLYDAMAAAGTNNDLIGSIFQKIGKKNDFLTVYNAFGRKSYVGYFVGGSPSIADKKLGNYDDLDLVEWLDNEVGISNPFLWSTIKKTVNNAGLAL